MSGNEAWGTFEPTSEQLVSIDQVLSLHEFVMGSVFRVARTRRSQAAMRWHSFTLQERNAHVGIYDGSEDTFLSGLVRKVDFGQWRTMLNLSTKINDGSMQRGGEREISVFDWDRNGNCMAWARTLVSHKDALGDTQLTNVNVHQITASECTALDERVRSISERALTVSRLLQETSLMPRRAA